MKSKLIVNIVFKNSILVASIFLIFVSLIVFTNQNNVILAQTESEKAYELQMMGGGAYVVSSSCYNSMFLVSAHGVIFVDQH